MHELKKVEEINFTFKIMQTGNQSTATNLEEKLAKIMLELPERFFYKKVSIQDPSILD